MKSPKIWKLRNNDDREKAIRYFSELLKIDNFSYIVDIAFRLAHDRLQEKEDVRRRIQKEVTVFKFIPEDFAWSEK